MRRTKHILVCALLAVVMCIGYYPSVSAAVYCGDENYGCQCAKYQEDCDKANRIADQPLNGVSRSNNVLYIFIPSTIILLFIGSVAAAIVVTRKRQSRQITKPPENATPHAAQQMHPEQPVQTDPLDQQ